MAEMRDPKYRILVGDCRETLRKIPSGIVQCVVTSPPYYDQRDYNAAGQIGLEKTPEVFFDSILAVFREIRRVLHPSGTVWMNLGDKYEDKKLLAMAWKTTFALVDDGWALRQDIIWNKTNPMPTPDCGRCTPAHEYVFLMSKTDDWYFDAMAAANWTDKPSVAKNFRGPKGSRYIAGKSFNNSAKSDVPKESGGGRSVVIETRYEKSVWDIPTYAEKECHTATFPPELAERCIKLGTSSHGCCAVCRSPYERVLKGYDTKTGDIIPLVDRNSVSLSEYIEEIKTVGWKKTCSCPGEDRVPCLVLDPFSGSGTAVGVALKLGRDAAGCELNEDYVEISRGKIERLRRGRGFALEV